MSTRAVHAALSWDGELRFLAESGTSRLLLDSEGLAGPSPVQAMAMSLAGCMAIDVVHILTRGRHPVTSVDFTLDGERAETEPRRLLRIRLHCRVGGGVAASAVERALQLSREKYCSVWHSMRQDIELVTTSQVIS
jgi:putative redox protein